MKDSFSFFVWCCPAFNKASAATKFGRQNWRCNGYATKQPGFDSLQEGRNLMNLERKQIGELLKLPEKYIIIDKAIYEPDYPNDLKVVKFLSKNDVDFASHISDYFVYPDYAIAKVLNQGIRLLVCLIYANLNDIPVGMIEHIKLRGLLYPNDQMNVLIKKWQDRSKIAKFEIGIENQKGLLVYESTVYGTLIKKTRHRESS
jgi:3-hydroxymyristoyl/3-hydroxydecanoyl-(acyl carrier protein) dehydratase